MSPHQVPPSLADAKLLAGFLSGDPAAREKFPKLHHKTLLSLARSAAPDLAKQHLTEDVVSEFWLLLLCKGPSYFDPLVHEQMWFQLTLLLRTAARTVRSQNPKPFSPKCPERTVAAKAAVATQKIASTQPLATQVNLVREKPVQVPMEMASETASLTPVNRGIHIDPAFRAADRKMEAEELLHRAKATAKPQVSAALAYVYLHDLSMTDAAIKVGMIPSTLRRNIDSWARMNLVD